MTFVATAKEVVKEIAEESFDLHSPSEGGGEGWFKVQALPAESANWRIRLGSGFRVLLKFELNVSLYKLQSVYSLSILI